VKMEELCVFVERDWFAYSLGVSLVLGILASFLPQHYAIIRTRTSDGTSWQSIFLSTLSASINTFNAMLEQYQSLTCCSSFGFWKCNGSLLSIYAIMMGFLNSLFLFGLVLLFFPKDFGHGEFEGENFKQKKRATMAFWGYVIVNFAVLPTLAYFLVDSYGIDSQEIQYFIFSLGVVSSAAIVVQWSPQIFQTWRSRHIGSLSMLMLLLQAPGSFINASFQAFLYNVSISTWFPFFVTGLQQLALLLICVGLKLKEKWNSRTQLEMEELSEPFIVEIETNVEPSSPPSN